MPPHSSTPTRAALRWVLLVPALITPLIASLFYAVFFPGTSIGNTVYTANKCFLVIWPLAAVCLVLREPMIDRTRPKRHLASLLPGTLFGAFVVAILFLMIRLSPLGATLSEHHNEIASFIHNLGVADYFIAYALFISFIHAAMEEFYWRWFTFGQAKHLMSPTNAGILAALCFASHHVVILCQFLPIGWALFLGLCVAIGGAVWTWLGQRYNSLLGSWASHMIIDLGLMWVGWEALLATLIAP